MKKTAFIFMEFQNDFLAKVGKLNLIKEGSCTRFIENAQKILQFARKNDLPIIHVHLLFSSSYSELREDIDGVLAVVKQAKAFQRGGDGVQAIDPFLPQEKERWIHKHSISAFEGTNLEEQLVDMGITDLVFTGLLSNVCLESSVRDAYDKGYRAFVIQDASSALDEKSHQHAVENVLPLFSTVCNTNTFLQKT